MALVPAGEFWQGRVYITLIDELGMLARARMDDMPARRVYLDAFHIDRREVTNAAYRAFTEATGHRRPYHWIGGEVPEGRDDFPVYNVSWDDAAAYCRWAGKRLPTETEWEKAARGGTDRLRFPWGDRLAAGSGEGADGKRAHYGWAEGPVATGAYPPNAYGIHDMVGNVAEWVADWYAPNYYSVAPAEDPEGPAGGRYRVVRSGSWNNSDERHLAVHYRNFADPATRTVTIGFRCAGSAQVEGAPAAASTGGSFEVSEDWAVLPPDAPWGEVSSVAVDPDGGVLVLRRADPSFYLLEGGALHRKWGEGSFLWAHGVRIDRDGFIWATDGRDHVVYKFDRDGRELLRLGQRGVAGDGTDTFDRPTDVAVAPNGDFFVADGYGNSRVVKFSPDGRFLQSWGTHGSEPGQFDLPHSIVIDPAGRVLVGDRENARVQVFDQQGRFLDEWRGLGKPYGLHIDDAGTLYVADADGGKITLAREGRPVEVIRGLGRPHWVAVERDGSILMADVRARIVRRITRAR